jgi:hypothetical protein
MRSAVFLLALAVVAGCGSSRPRSPEDVARAWSAALDRNDNDAAGRLFAGGATVVQSDSLRLHTRADAVRWNAELPCGSRIDRVEQQGAGRVFVVFTLESRPAHRCDAPGERAAVLFSVRDGKIVLWHQLPVPPAPRSGELV